jgi:hypothetical protein
MTGGQRLISWLHPCSTSNVALNTHTCAHGPSKLGRCDILCHTCFSKENQVCCGESRSFRSRTMRENLNSRTKSQNVKRKDKQKLLSQQWNSQKSIPFTCAGPSPFIGRRGGLFTFREHPRVKRIKTECARLSSGNLQLGLHVIGAS